MTQPRALSREQVRRVDSLASEKFHIPGIVLMENAGRGAAALLAATRIRGPILICAGKGNNGGDGFVMARHLSNGGHEIRVLLFADPATLRGDAAINYRILAASGLAIQVYTERTPAKTLRGEFTTASWLVDALLGTGFQGTVREPWATVIEAMNDSGTPIFSVDLPSGLDCDTGTTSGACIRATQTATFVARKIGFDHPAAQGWTGRVDVVEIGVPLRLLEEI